MAAMLLAACALSPATVEERTPKLEYATKGTVALTVVDNRPFVVSGEKEEACEGIYRGGYGIPFAFEGMRKDDEGTPYTTRISEILSKALYNAGSTANVIQTPKGSSVQSAINGLRAVPFDAGLIVNVLDSRIDAGGARWSYFFDYEIIVIDHAGTIVSRKKYDGEDVDFQRELFHSGNDKGKNYSFAAVLDLHYRNKFAAYLNDREMQAALASPRAVAATAGARGQADRGGAQRLAELKAMLDKGLITPDDYEEKKAEILQSL